MTITPTLILFNAISKASLLRLHKIILTHKITVKEIMTKELTDVSPKWS